MFYHCSIDFIIRILTHKDTIFFAHLQVKSTKSAFFLQKFANVYIFLYLCMQIAKNAVDDRCIRQ